MKIRDMETVGELIAKHRKSAGLAQGALAAACGWFNEDGEPSQPRISNYEKGIRETSIDDLRAIAHALNINAIMLIPGAYEEGIKSGLINNQETEDPEFLKLKLLWDHLSAVSRRAVVANCEALAGP